MLGFSHPSLVHKQLVYLFTFNLGAIKTTHQFTSSHHAHGVVTLLSLYIFASVDKSIVSNRLCYVEHL